MAIPLEQILRALHYGAVDNLFLRFSGAGIGNIQFQCSSVRKPAFLTVGVGLQQMACLRIQQPDSAAG